MNEHNHPETGVVSIDGRNIVDVTESFVRYRRNLISLALENTWGTPSEQVIQNRANDDEQIFAIINARVDNALSFPLEVQFVELENILSYELDVKDIIRKSMKRSLEVGELYNRERHLQTMLTNAQIGFTDPLDR